MLHSVLASVSLAPHWG